MKHLTSYLSAVILAAVSLSSCSQYAEDGLVKARITMTVDPFVYDDISPYLTKTSVDPVHNFAITWADGDIIGIFPREGLQEPFKIPADQIGSGTASFDGGYWEIKNGLSYNAYYPFSLENYSTWDMISHIPVTYEGQYQNGQECNAGAFDYTYSDWATASMGKVNFAFHHLGSFLVLTLPIPATSTYSSLELVAEDALIPVNGTYDLTSLTPSFIPDESSLSATLKMDLNGFSGVEGENAVFYMMMPPVDLSSTELRVILTAESGSCIYELDNVLNIKAAKLYRRTGTVVENNTTGTVDPWEEEEDISGIHILSLDPPENMPYISDPVSVVYNWSQFSDSILGRFDISCDQFNKDYYIVRDSYLNPMIYIKNGDQFQASENAVSALFYSSVVNANSKSLAWTINPYFIGEGQSLTFYVCFKKSDVDMFYVGLPVHVASHAEYIFGKKIANEWYNDIDNEIKNTIRFNVPVPVADKADPVKGGDVTIFSHDLNHSLQVYQPQLTLSPDSDPIYAHIAANESALASSKSIAPSLVYSFSEDQPAIDGIQLITDEEGKKLYAAAYDSQGRIRKESNGRPLLLNDNLIAYFKGGETSVITYNWTKEDTVAKQLLNKWSFIETDQSSMFYANIQVSMYYGPCKIPAGKDHFHVRFIRPLDIQYSTQSVSEETALDGFNVNLVKFIAGITDWNQQKVIIDSLDINRNPTGNMVANVIKTVNMYAYYQFETLEIDLANAIRNNVDADNLNRFMKLAEVTPGARLTIGTVDEKGVFTANEAENANVVDIKKFDSIKGLVLNYSYDEAVVESFTIRVPTKVHYVWGVIDGELIIDIVKTADTEGK